MRTQGATQGHSGRAKRSQNKNFTEINKNVLSDQRPLAWDDFGKLQSCPSFYQDKCNKNCSHEGKTQTACSYLVNGKQRKKPHSQMQRDTAAKVKERWQRWEGPGNLLSHHPISVRDREVGSPSSGESPSPQHLHRLAFFRRLPGVTYSSHPHPNGRSWFCPIYLGIGNMHCTAQGGQ